MERDINHPQEITPLISILKRQSNQNEAESGGDEDYLLSNEFFHFEIGPSLDNLLKSTKKGGTMGTVFTSIFTTKEMHRISVIRKYKEYFLIGFGNGAFVKVNCETLQLDYIHSDLTPNECPIDQLEILELEEKEEIAFLFMLFDGKIYVYYYQNMYFLDMVPQLQKCNDFQLYQCQKEEMTARLAARSGKNINLYKILIKDPPKKRNLDGSKARHLLKIRLQEVLSLESAPTSYAVWNRKIVHHLTKHTEMIDFGGEKPKQTQLFNLSSKEYSSIVYVPIYSSFLVTRGLQSFFVDDSAPLENNPSFTWSQPPTHIFVVEPYFVAVLDTHIEIRNIFKPKLIFQKHEYMSAKVLLWTTDYIFSLSQKANINVPNFYLISNQAAMNKPILCKFTQEKIENQAKILVDAKLYLVALQICDLFLSKQEKSKTEYKSSSLFKEYQILQKDRAFYSFIIQKDYETSRKLFEKHKVEPHLIFFLFPELFHKSNLNRLKELLQLDVFSEIPFVYSLEHYQLKGLPFPNDVLFSQTYGVALRTFLGYFKKLRDSLREKLELLKTKKVFTSFRSPGSPFAHHKIKDFGKGISSVHSMELQDDALQMISGKTENQIEKLCCMITLCEIYVFHASLLLIQIEKLTQKVFVTEFKELIMKPNSLPVPYCEDLFLKYKLYEKLFSFLYHKQLYERIFELLRTYFIEGKKFSSNVAGTYEKVKGWIILYIKYIQKIHSKKLMSEQAILKEIKWFFEKEKIAEGLDCFKPYKQTNVPFFSPSIVIFIEEEGGIASSIKYLDWISNETNLNSRELANTLAKFHIRQIKSIIANKYKHLGGFTDKIEIAEIENDVKIVMARNKFFTFLQESKTYEPELIIELLPDFLLREKGFLYLKLRKYAEGFTILVFQLNMALIAIDLADKIFSEYKDENCLLILIESILQNQEIKENTQMAASIIDHYYQFLNPRKILEIIPEGTKIANISNAISRIFSHLTSLQNNSKIEESCYEWSLLRATEDSIRSNEKYIRIATDTCHICKQPIEPNVPFVRTTNQLLFHYTCIPEEDIQNYIQV